MLRIAKTIYRVGDRRLPAPILGLWGAQQRSPILQSRRPAEASALPRSLRGSDRDHWTERRGTDQKGFLWSGRDTDGQSRREVPSIVFLPGPDGRRLSLLPEGHSKRPTDRSSALRNYTKKTSNAKIGPLYTKLKSSLANHKARIHRSLYHVVCITS